ncbi:AraC-like DNA-binding protein [Parabacteroides sp. PFB2-10]|uniref:AraC family transcriptional regulator n=1 Tax=Parabacteroides sp. PFB2-10 TaxID=1742405 RepID=UPI0024764AA4|nr:AraC family transcriptional regulator [Parabacteroides sp. PFB2-10]MDH6313943.1 AraC-like DNA-binding protein [Parabacteroides sp. PFB2-10]
MLPFMGLSGARAQEANPFAGLVGKSYAEYYTLIQAEYDRAGGLDSLGRWEQIRQFYEVAEQTETDDLRINAEIFEYVARFRESRQGGHTPRPHYTAQDYIKDMLSAADKAGESGFTEIRANTLFMIAENCRIYLEDYELAFEYYRATETELERLDAYEFPLKYYYYLEIGNFYLSFRDYENALPYYDRIIEGPPSGWNYWYIVKHAYNGRGIAFRALGDMERSSDNFSRILSLPPGDNQSDNRHEMLVAVAIGNLGNNDFLTGKYAEAAVRLRESMEVMAHYQDYVFASSKAVSLAETALILGNTADAGRYLTLARDYGERPRTPVSGIGNYKRDYFRVAAKYYATIGQAQTATACIDSMRQAERNYSEEFNTRRLLRVEQRMRRTETEAHAEALRHEKEQKTLYLRSLIITLVASALLLSLFILLIVLYRRNRAAYRELVHHAEEWAKKENTDAPAQQNNAPDSQDRVIMEKIEELMNEHKRYKDSGISLDSLAAELELSRFYVSRAINHCAGKNLSAYLNEYRIKEAIHIMSEKNTMQLSIDAIATDAGFNDRKSFHRIFKQYTGVSPSVFRDNVGK